MATDKPKYKSLSLVSPIQGPVIQAGDRYLQNATVSDGFAITRDGAFYYVSHPEWLGETLEVPAARVAGAILSR